MWTIFQSARGKGRTVSRVKSKIAFQNEERMNNLISNPIVHPTSVGSVLAGRARRQRISSLLALTMMGVVCALPASGLAMAATLSGAAPAASAPAVKGMPRLAHGHPYTLWGNQEIAAYKATLATDPSLKAAFDELRAWGDKRVAEPLNVPEHKLEADGSWTYPNYKRGFQDASGKWNWEWEFNGALQKRSEDVSNLGMLYALTGDEKYAAFAKQMLLALADAYGNGKGSTTPEPHGYNHFEAYGFDGGDIGMFLAKACQGYDLIYNVPSVSKDHARIEGELIRPLAEQLKKSSFMYTTHDRWGMVCLYGIFIAGETLNDSSLMDLALFGQGGTRDKVTGGFMDCFKPDVLREGVVWGVGTTKIDDQMAALSVLTAVAEVLWHHDVDLYSYQDAALKKSFDAALKPVGSLDASGLRSLPGVDAYRYAFRRYPDQRYVSVIGKLTPGFTLAIGEHLPSPPTSESTVK
jgi:hypothetical protein